MKNPPHRIAIVGLTTINPDFTAVGMLRTLKDADRRPRPSIENGPDATVELTKQPRSGNLQLAEGLGSAVEFEPGAG